MWIANALLVNAKRPDQARDVHAFAVSVGLSVDHPVHIRSVTHKGCHCVSHLTERLADWDASTVGCVGHDEEGVLWDAHCGACALASVVEDSAVNGVRDVGQFLSWDASLQESVLTEAAHCNDVMLPFHSELGDARWHWVVVNGCPAGEVQFLECLNAVQRPEVKEDHAEAWLIANPRLDVLRRCIKRIADQSFREDRVTV